MIASVLFTSTLIVSSYALAIPQSEDILLQPSAFGNFQVDYTASVTYTPTPTSTMESFVGSSTTPTSWTLSTTITAVSSEASAVVSTDTTCTTTSSPVAPPAYGTVDLTTPEPTTTVPTIIYIGSSTTPTSWTLSSTITSVDSLSQGPTSTGLETPFEYGTIAPPSSVPVETSIASSAELVSSSSTPFLEEDLATEVIVDPIVPSATSPAIETQYPAPPEYGNPAVTSVDAPTIISPAGVNSTSTPCTSTLTVTRTPTSETDVSVAPVVVTSSATTSYPPIPSGPPVFYDGGNSTVPYMHPTGTAGPTGTGFSTGIIAPTGVVPSGVVPSGSIYSSSIPVLLPTTMTTLATASANPDIPTSTALVVPVAPTAYPASSPENSYYSGSGTMRQRLRSLGQLLGA
ncbi:hypothetical protein MBLNU230_g3228t1 [Neophaeotheca triangularis]